MEEEKSSIDNWKRLDTISFRGERKVWQKFLLVSKKKCKKSTWEILSKLILKYLEREGRE